MNWKHEAEAVAEALYPDGSERQRQRRVGAVAGFLYGSGAALTWASNAEAVERAARALNADGWTCTDGAHEPGEYDDCHYCRVVCLGIARTALTAAIGDGDE